MHQRWQQCTELLAQELSDQAFHTWIKPLCFVGHDLDRHRIRLAAPTVVKARTIQAQYGQLIRQLVRKVYDDGELGVQIEVIGSNPGGIVTPPHQDRPVNGHGPGAVPNPARGALADRAGTVMGTSGEDAESAPSRSAPSQTTADWADTQTLYVDDEDFGEHDGGVPAAEPDPSEMALPEDARALSAKGAATTEGASARAEGAGARGSSEARRASERAVPPSAGAFAGLSEANVDDRTRLNLGLSFGNFVTGKANDLARAAALQVAERPGVAYNPLYIHGGVGLGKTHLMHAVGNAIRLENPNASIRYLTANQLVQDMLKAIRGDKIEDFKRYFQSLDLLLIDDIQFLSDKKRSQEEFFYVFEALVANRRQIIITGDTYPKELPKMDDRLVSRFNSGLIVAIEPPELEMRVAILLRKAEAAQVKVPEEVAFFVAKHIKQNVRELEGALKTIIHGAAFLRAPITLDLVKETLKGILSYNRGQISIELIQQHVADRFKIKLADMYSQRRPAKIALPRQIAMYLAKELTQKSLPEIGEAFGGRDHTTVLYAVRKIAELRAHKSELNHDIHVLEQTLREYL